MVSLEDGVGSLVDSVGSPGEFESPLVSSSSEH